MATKKLQPTPPLTVIDLGDGNEVIVDASVLPVERANSTLKAIQTALPGAYESLVDTVAAFNKEYLNDNEAAFLTDAVENDYIQTLHQSLRYIGRAVGLHCMGLVTRGDIPVDFVERVKERTAAYGQGMNSIELFINAFFDVLGGNATTVFQTLKGINNE